MRAPSGVAEELIRGPEPADPEEWSADGDGANNFIQPLFDPADFRFDRFLKSDPPKRKWVIEGVLPLGVAGLLASMGGAGKSFLMYQLGLCITTGRPFLGMEMGEPGSFLYLAAEDDEAELHRRGLTLIEHYERMAGPFDRKAVAEQLYVVPRVASVQPPDSRRWPRRGPPDRTGGAPREGRHSDLGSQDDRLRPRFPIPRRRGQ